MISPLFVEHGLGVSIYQFPIPCGVLNVIVYDTDSVKIIAHNNTTEDATVDLSKVHFKIGDWYYYIPYFGMFIPQLHSYEFDAEMVTPVDNLTLVEELAKERSLI